MKKQNKILPLILQLLQTHHQFIFENVKQLENEQKPNFPESNKSIQNDFSSLHAKLLKNQEL